MAVELKAGLYEHYKGNLYEVIGVATHSEDESALVVYRANYGEQGLWVRPLSMFVEDVIVNGEPVPRFKFIGNVESHLE